MKTTVKVCESCRNWLAATESKVCRPCADSRIRWGNLRRINREIWWARWGLLRRMEILEEWRLHG